MTIHKTQGATVDRAFVLASGTMDRHLTYVAMTRHRDGVQLHAGRDEFKDDKALSATLSRAGLKETTLDCTRAYALPKGLASKARSRFRRSDSRIAPSTIFQEPIGRGRALAPKKWARIWRGKKTRDVDLAADRHDASQRRGKFAGLRLSRVRSSTSSKGQSRARQGTAGHGENHAFGVPARPGDGPRHVGVFGPGARGSTRRRHRARGPRRRLSRGRSCATPRKHSTGKPARRSANATSSPA